MALKPIGKYYTQEIMFLTVLFDKEYYWMRDVDGTWYLSKVGEDDKPIL